VNEFVDQCRREWRRLGVSQAVAQEMAEELTADLAEGASAEDVLGTDAVDARSFAARWARERDVIEGRRWKPRIPAALATVALTPAIAGAVLLIAASPQEPSPATLTVPSSSHGVWVATPAPPAVRERVQAAVAAAENARLARVLVIAGDENVSEDDNDDTLGSILLIVGLAGLVPLTLFWLVRPRRV
jgi:hypothetical protein